MRNPYRGLPREVAVLAAVALSVAIGYGFVAPAIPEFARSFGVSRTAAGAVISAFALMRFVSAMAGGRLVDVFGERVILAAGIFVVAVSTGLSGLAQTYEQLLILRGAGGIGSAMFTVSANALLLRVVERSNRGRATGLYQSGFLIGGLLGPAVGGLLTTHSLRLPFYVYAVSLLAAGSIGLVFLAGARQRSGPSDTPTSEPTATTSVRDLLRHPAYQAAVLVNFSLGWTIMGLRMSLFPLFVTDSLGRTALWVGIGFAVSAMAQALLVVVAGHWVDTYGRRPGMIGGTLLIAASITLMALAPFLVTYLLAMVLLGVGGAFIGAAPGAVVGDLMEGRGGQVVAVFQMASDLGVIVGPVAAGWLADHVSYTAALGTAVVIMTLAALAAWRMPETLGRHETPAR